MPPSDDAAGLAFNVLREPLIWWRDAGTGDTHESALPEVFAALASDSLRAFPHLRPHQRHPWHAFLVQLAAIALHRAGQAQAWTTAEQWRAALLALTSDRPDEAAWCLVSPSEQPALLQPPVPGEDPRRWTKHLHAADELDMLVTSRGHDLKAARARCSKPDDWLFALTSLQTQEGFLGAGNYGISRMNGGFASRPGVGVAPVGTWGQRWLGDITSLLAERSHIARTFGLACDGGHALLWLVPWSGTDALSMASLDPLYIEICRRVRLAAKNGTLQAYTVGSKTARIASDAINGRTGDAWTPVDTAASKALTVSRNGFDYKLMAELLAGDRYTHGAAWRLDGWPRDVQLQAIAQATVRGQGKTEGYHERRVPISPRLRRLLAGGQRQIVARLANDRIQAIAEMRKLLRSSLVLLFANGEHNSSNDTIDKRAGLFARPFEQQEDGRFFDDLHEQVEAEGTSREADVYLYWLRGLMDRAEAILRGAFDAGPRSSMQRYKARAAALSRFRGGLYASKAAPLAALVAHLAEQRTHRQSATEGTTRA